jgi:phospholipase/carboxylesterase
MNPFSPSLVHRVLAPEKSNASLHPTVILLHGLGADENDLLGLSQALDARCRFISVRAPFTLDYGGYTWYDFLVRKDSRRVESSTFGEAGKPEPKMFKESCGKLAAFINDASIHYSINPKELYLLGFSMGTVMSLAMALSQPKVFRGVIANSGYLAEQTHLEYRWSELNGLDFFVAHGTFDPLIPVQASRSIRDTLEAANAKVEYHEFPMAHEISDESLNAMARWLTTRID